MQQYKQVLMEDEIIEYSTIPTSNMGCCRLSAMSVVGNMALFIRTLTVIGLFVSSLVTTLIQTGVIQTSPVLWVAVGIQCVAMAIVSMDAKNIKWMVEKLINQLSHNLVQLKASLQESRAQLSRRDDQIKKVDVQLSKSNEQLEIREQQLTEQNMALQKMTAIQVNMKTLLNSLMNAESEGANLNELFARNLEKFETLINHLANTSFADIDQDGDNLISIEEFRIYTARGGGKRPIVV